MKGFCQILKRHPEGQRAAASHLKKMKREPQAAGMTKHEQLTEQLLGLCARQRPKQSLPVLQDLRLVMRQPALYQFA